MLGLSRKGGASPAVPLLLAVGVLLSLGAFFYLRAAERDASLARLDRQVAQVHDVLKERIDSHILLLHALRGIFADVFARPVSLSRARLAEAIKPVRPLIPSLHTVGWARRIDPSGVSSLEQAMRDDGVQDFAVHEGSPSKDGDRFVVVLTEPAMSGEVGLGVDIAALPNHAEALAHACRTGSVAMTDASNLPGHRGRERSYVVYMPVFSGPAPERSPFPGGSPGDLCGRVTGYMMATFHLDPFITDVLDRPRQAPGDLYLLDRSAPAGQRLLAARPANDPELSDGGRPEAFLPLGEGELVGGPLLRRDMWFGGRQWQLVLAPPVLSGAASRNAWGVLIVGLLLTGILTGYVRREQQAKRLLQAEARARAAMARALRESEERFRMALRHSRISLCSHDRDLRYVWVYNPQTPVPPEAFLGRTHAQVYGAANGALLDAVKRPVIATGIGVRQEVRLDLDGRSIVFDLVVEPLRDDAGGVSGLICAAIDLTEAYEIREALARAHAEAERANQAKSRFLAAASHDLRQPFQAMGLFHHILMGMLTDPAQQEMAGKLGEALQAGNALLAALLDTSALEAGNVKPRFVEFAFQDIAERLSTEIAGQAHAKGLGFGMVPCSAWVCSDPVLLERMLRNLLVNALRYTPEGRILLGCRRRGNRLSIEVWDTGPGIPQDQLEKIFEDFYRCGTDQRDSTRGLGLGLSIVRRMSQILDHPVSVRSWEGKGTVFSVSVAVVAEQPATENAPVLAPAAV